MTKVECVHKFEAFTLPLFRINGPAFVMWRKCALCGVVVDFVDLRIKRRRT